MINYKNIKETKMKTVRELKNELDPKVFEMSDLEKELDIVIPKKEKGEIEIKCDLKNKIQDISSLIRLQRKSTRGEISRKYQIKDEKIIDLFRNLYKTTNNSFIKSVLKTVGTTKTFTEKQIDIICEEISKIDSFVVSL